MIEVEVKVKLSDNQEDMDKLIEALKADEFKCGNITKETDVYFNSKIKDFRESDEALRLRKVEALSEGYIVADNDGISGEKQPYYQLTYKGQKLDDISMSRLEVSSGIRDYDEMKTILEALGYYSVPPVIKTRKYLFGEEMVACIDEVEGLGNFMELEIIVDKEDEREKALLLIEKQLARLGLSMDDTTTISYLSMLENKANSSS